MAGTITNKTYQIMDAAVEFFNAEFWQGRLPAPALLFHRHRGALGYCARKAAYSVATKTSTDEIALNPDTFKGRTLQQVAGTLVHEMCHAWQNSFGKPSRNGYHNREWGREMKRVGLFPSASAAPGGKETGPRVSHYLIVGGPYEKAFGKFLTLHPQAEMDWFTSSLGGNGRRPDKRTFCCPDCDQKAWAKESAKLVCGNCETEMEMQ